MAGPELQLLIALVATFGLLVGIRRLLVLRRSRRVIETGLKAVDLFAPILRGGDILITGDEGAGSIVLGSELAYRLMNLPARHHHVLYYLDDASYDIDERVQELDEVLPALTHRYIVPVVTADHVQQHLSDVRRGSDTMIFAASMNTRFLEIFQESIRQVREDAPGAGSVTSFSVTDSIVPTTYDVTIQSSKVIAEAGIYPAIDPQRSASSASKHSSFRGKRLRVARSAGKAVTEVISSLYAGALNDATWIYNSDADRRPACQALCFMSQAYFVAEIYTGKTGAYIPVKQTVDSFETILSENMKGTAAKAFRYRNKLPTV